MGFDVRQVSRVQTGLPVNPGAPAQSKATVGPDQFRRGTMGLADLMVGRTTSSTIHPQAAAILGKARSLNLPALEGERATLVSQFELIMRGK